MTVPCFLGLLRSSIAAMRSFRRPRAYAKLASSDPAGSVKFSWGCASFLDNISCCARHFLRSSVLPRVPLGESKSSFSRASSTPLGIPRKRMATTGNKFTGTTSKKLPRLLSRFWCKLSQNECRIVEKNLCRGYAARTAAQMSGADTGLPGKFPILNCCLRIFSASSMPLIELTAG